ncbi:DMT family transporter [uncultured Mycolicibacterium sp.]|uniref:EamA family transporter n=1 Tax=uncultured Mycolicibacterium sp. TaxID=2320817 RepID=UPI00262749D2|nr:DMT family transporter [uncultured Mycolicibacterium sp.]
MAHPEAGSQRFRAGLGFAIASAVCFGTSGSFGKTLLNIGWTPAAAVFLRLAGAALVMAAAATLLRRGWVREALRHPRTVIGYGIIPVAGTQLCYYSAIEHLSVSVALLLEYTAPILVVAWMWATTRRRPSNTTLAGVAIALAGTTLVLDIYSGVHLNLVGLAWAMAAAVCVACFFVMSDTGDEDDGLDAVTLTAAGLVVGTVLVGLLGATGVLRLTFVTADTVLAGHAVPWFVPAVAIAVVSTAMAYVLGILGIARLKPRFASMVGLSEVLFATLAAWVLLGEAISAAQAVGGLIVLAGLALARYGDRSDARPELDAAPLPADRHPTTGPA